MCFPRLIMSHSALWTTFTQTMCAAWFVLYVHSITGIICSQQGLSIGVIQFFGLIPHLVIYRHRANAKYFKGNSNSRDQTIYFVSCTMIFFIVTAADIFKLACGPETRETKPILSDIFIVFIFLPYLNGVVPFALRLQTSRCFSSSPGL